MTCWPCRTVVAVSNRVKVTTEERLIEDELIEDGSHRPMSSPDLRAFDGCVFPRRIHGHIASVAGVEVRNS